MESIGLELADAEMNHGEHHMGLCSLSMIDVNNHRFLSSIQKPGCDYFVIWGHFFKESYTNKAVIIGGDHFKPNLQRCCPVLNAQSLHGVFKCVVLPV